MGALVSFNDDEPLGSDPNIEKGCRDRTSAAAKLDHGFRPAGIDVGGHEPCERGAAQEDHTNIEWAPKPSGNKQHVLLVKDS